jgi:hypothetical protein
LAAERFPLSCGGANYTSSSWHLGQYLNGVCVWTPPLEKSADTLVLPLEGLVAVNNIYCAEVSYVYQYEGTKTVSSGIVYFKVNEDTTKKTINWLETKYNDIYAGEGIDGGKETPDGKNNATDFVQTGNNDSIVDFTSSCPYADDYINCLFINYYLGLEFPAAVNNYTNFLAKLDIKGIKNGYYGKVSTLIDLQSFEQLCSVNDPRQVFFCRDNCEIRNFDLSEGGGLINSCRSRLVVVEDTDLIIKGNIVFIGDYPVEIEDLSSVAFIVLGGDILIEPQVEEISGLFFSDGLINTCSGNPVDCKNSLKVHGALIAKQIFFNRSGGVEGEGAEQIIFDPRLVLNPPAALKNAIEEFSF